MPQGPSHLYPRCGGPERFPSAQASKRAPGQYASGRCSRFECSLGVVGRVAYHHGLECGKSQLFERHLDKARVRIAVFDIVAAGSRTDKSSTFRSDR